ncbi:MAG: hypothetical protein Q4E02_00440, partial [Lagierella massiliensis]|nr:hypothetical protein [Lagierella massiliensis]
MKNSRVLAFLLTFVMIFTTIDSSVFATAFRSVNKDDSVELEGEVVGQKKVFNIDKELLVDSGDKNTKSNMTYLRRSFLGGALFEDATIKNTSTRNADNTTIVLNTKGLNGGVFDWSVFEENKFEIIFSKTVNGAVVEIDRIIVDKSSGGTITKYIDWPVGTGADTVQISTSFDGNYDVRAEFTRGNSFGSEGKFTFNLTIIEIPNTELKVKYKDIYGNTLLENKPTPEANESLPNIKLGDGTFELPTDDKSANLRNLNDAAEDSTGFPAVFGDDAADAIVDFVETEILNSYTTLPFTVNGNIEGEFTLGTGDNQKTYKYTVNQESKSDPTVITVTYMADIAVPTPNIEGDVPEAPQGYARLTFNADEVDSDGIKGQFKASIGDSIKNRYVDVKDNLEWNNPKINDAYNNIEKPEPLKEGVVDVEKFFKKWNETLPSTGTVQTKNFNAVYADKAVIIPYLPTEPEPTVDPDGNTISESYITVTFQTEDETKGTVKVGDKLGAKVFAKVKPGTDLSTLKDPENKDLIVAVAKENYGFVKWQPALGLAQADSPYIASFLENGSEINEGEDDIPKGWYTVTVKQDDTILDNTVPTKYYAVESNKTLKANTLPDLANKEKNGYKNPSWYKDSDTTATLNPETVEIIADTTFTASATKKTDKETVEELGGLEPVNLAKFKGESIEAGFWKGGVTPKTTVAADKAKAQALLDKATVTDKSGRTTTTAGEYVGTLTVKFADGTTVDVANQKLYVYENGADKPEEGTPVPVNSVVVTYKAGEGVTTFVAKEVLVKKGTKEGDLPSKPSTSLVDGYKNLVWTANPEIDATAGIQKDTVVTASATKKTDAEKVTELGGLEPVNLAKFKGESI